MKARSFLLVAALAAAVSSAGAQVPGRVVMGGKAVTLVADVVYAFPTLRPSVVAVGGTDQGLGVFLETVSPGFSGLPAFDRQAGAETYASFKPDLCILKSSLKKGVGAGIEALGIKALYLSLETPDDYYRELALLGGLAGAPGRATELIAYYKDIVARAEAAAAGSRAPKPRVLLMQAAGDGFEAPPASWMQTILVELAGGEAVWKGANPGSGWAALGPEQIAAWNPDMIVLVSYKENAATLAARFKADPRFSSLAASRAGRVYGFAQDFLSWDQPDPRWGMGLLWLANAMRPGSLPGYSAEAEARRFFKLFYGMGDAAFNAAILPRMGGDWK